MLGKFAWYLRQDERRKKHTQQPTYTYTGSGYRISRARWHRQQRIARSTFYFLLLLLHACCGCCCCSDSIFSSCTMIERAKSASDTLLLLVNWHCTKRTIYEKRKIYVNTQHAPNSPYYTYNLCCLFAQGILLYVWLSEWVCVCFYF